MGYYFFKSAVKPKPLETLQAWGQRCLGKEATDYLLCSGVQGIYATSPERLSANLVLKTLFHKKNKIGKRQGSVSPEKGMGAWIEQMQIYLESQGCEFRLQTEWASPEPSVTTVLACDLMATKKIIEKHNGTISVNLGKNLTTFKITITNE